MLLYYILKVDKYIAYTTFLNLIHIYLKEDKVNNIMISKIAIEKEEQLSEEINKLGYAEFDKELDKLKIMTSQYTSKRIVSTDRIVSDIIHNSDFVYQKISNVIKIYPKIALYSRSLLNKNIVTALSTDILGYIRIIIERSNLCDEPSMYLDIIGLLSMDGYIVSI